MFSVLWTEKSYIYGFLSFASKTACSLSVSAQAVYYLEEKKAKKNITHPLGQTLDA